MKDSDVPDTDVIFGHRVCQTAKAKWLCIDNIYQKLHRPNLYDIGGTYAEDVADYWFIYRTEMIADIHLLHLFINNRTGGSFDVSVSSSNDLSFKKKHNQAFLTSNLKTYKFDNRKEMSQNYVTTYDFSVTDIEMLMNMKFYIAVSFGHKLSPQSISDRVSTIYDFKPLLNDPLGSDFVIECADGAKFNVHKILLSTNSEVFRAMLKENTAESQNSYLKMVDVGKEDLQYILEFIYTGSIEDIENANFFNLLTLSERYDLASLKELSEHVLAGQLTIDNCIETLAVADFHNSEGLKLTALKFIKCNKIAIHSEMFQELNNVELIKELCQFLVPCL
ncbi:TD and POZ domain-containing protein 2-like [Vanessa atalanta]|uniref:TD and POZ domain-containing protein 2-like n=1 Tax=Vanessa atalanta TaxID=42275 RepID=UPI001FCD4A4C|nr:TD and POZ domain-containing protein 2-like [Vanessa atalanta]